MPTAERGCSVRKCCGIVVTATINPHTGDRVVIDGLQLQRQILSARGQAANCDKTRNNNKWNKRD
jgi:hypothetical protein